MNDVGQIGSDCTGLHFPPLLDWEEVLQEERADRLGSLGERCMHC